jgi:hypothetical protein
LATDGDALAAEDSCDKSLRDAVTATDMMRGLAGLRIFSRYPRRLRRAAFVPFSFEVSQDALNFTQERGVLLADSYDQLTATAFTTGSGTNQPSGVVTTLSATLPRWSTVSAPMCWPARTSMRYRTRRPKIFGQRPEGRQPGDPQPAAAV